MEWPGRGQSHHSRSRLTAPDPYAAATPCFPVSKHRGLGHTKHYSATLRLGLYGTITARNDDVRDARVPLRSPSPLLQ